MKFCYLDESGTGSEPFAVMVGIIVDHHRMHLTKKDWSELLSKLSKNLNKEIREFHTRDFYKGNGPWRNMSGEKRSDLIKLIIEWLKERKHKITFCAVDKEAYYKEFKNNEKLRDLHCLWCFMAFHQALIIQKHFQQEKKGKGNTILIFDREVKEEKNLCKLIFKPPIWTNTYYKKRRKQEHLDQIVDVPYFGDSEQVHLLQVADLIAYFIRLYLEISSGKIKENYKGELDFLKDFIKEIQSISLPISSRYLLKGRDECSELFFKLAPKEIINIK
jgi:hypothetical protein